jgi:hypothetical protein
MGTTSAGLLFYLRSSAFIRGFPMNCNGSELYPKAKSITTDVRDFKVYRRFRNEILPLLHP